MVNNQPTTNQIIKLSHNTNPFKFFKYSQKNIIIYNKDFHKI